MRIEGVGHVRGKKQWNYRMQPNAREYTDYRERMTMPMLNLFFFSPDAQFNFFFSFFLFADDISGSIAWFDREKNVLIKWNVVFLSFIFSSDSYATCKASAEAGEVPVSA